jgi:zinc protease
MVLHKPAPVASISLVVRTLGTRALGKSGVAALTTRMLEEGTRAQSNLELAEAVEALGTSLDTESERDWARVSLDVLSTDVGRAMELLAEVVQFPRFDARDFERVRAQWLDGLAAERKDPARIASLVAVRVLLGGPEGEPPDGSVRDVKALSVPDLREYHRRVFVPGNAAVLVTGDVTLATMRALAEKSFGRWRGAAPPVSDPFVQPPAPERTRVVVVDRPDSVQSVLLVAQPFPRRSDEGHEARELLSAIVAGLFTSRVNQNLREDHAYTYGAFGTAVETARWGAYVISTSVETRVTGAALVALVGELDAARRGPAGKAISPEELQHAKSELISNAGAHLEHTSRLLDELTTIFAERLRQDTFARYPETLAAVARETVERCAGELLTPSRLLVVIVGDRRHVEPDLRSKGFRVDIAEPSLLD